MFWLEVTITGNAYNISVRYFSEKVLHFSTLHKNLNNSYQEKTNYFRFSINLKGDCLLSQTVCILLINKYLFFNAVSVATSVGQNCLVDQRKFSGTFPNVS